MDIGQDKKPFRKIYVDENNELFQELIKDPLLWTLFTLCTMKARRTIELSPRGLCQNEFWLSETEYSKFGLKNTQKGQIPRKLKILMSLILLKKHIDRYVKKELQ